MVKNKLYYNWLSKSKIKDYAGLNVISSICYDYVIFVRKKWSDKSLFGEHLELLVTDHKEGNISNLHDGIQCLVHHIFNKEINLKKTNKIAKYLINNNLLLRINLETENSSFYWITFETLNKIYNLIVNFSFDFQSRFDLNYFIKNNNNYKLITLKEYISYKKDIEIEEEDRKLILKICKKLNII